jgi:hypothetical protein
MREESSEPLENSKGALWRKEEEEVGRTVDKRGRHVDAGIREAVAALHVFGLETDSSCEGHADRGTRAPYIDVGRVPEELARRMKAGAAEGANYDEETLREMRETREKILHQLERLMELLGEFYGGRDGIAEARRLVLKIIPNGARLQSQSAELQEHYPLEKQAEQLKYFQEEMDAFKDFLKGKFLSQP